MNRARLVEQQIPERYVAGQLSPEESAEFEEYILEHPEVIDQVELARHLKLGLHTLSERGTLQNIIGSKPAQDRRWLAAAGLAAMAFLIGLSAWFRSSPELLLSASVDSRPIAGEYILVRTRAAEEVTFAIPAEPAVLLVKLEAPRSTTATHYQVDLVRGTETAGRLDSIEAGPDGWLVVYVNPASLAPGEYRFVVRDPASPTAPANEFPFRLEAGQTR